MPKIDVKRAREALRQASQSTGGRGQSSQTNPPEQANNGCGVAVLICGGLALLMILANGTGGSSSNPGSKPNPPAKVTPSTDAGTPQSSEPGLANNQPATTTVTVSPDSQADFERKARQLREQTLSQNAFVVTPAPRRRFPQ